MRLFVYPHGITQMKHNKAGYTAKTSRGRVGRGENARVQLKRDEPTNLPTNWQMDKASYRVACPRLKKNRWGQD